MNLIAAVDKNWGIGRDGGLLAHLPTDMKYFKEHTLGKVVVMGRKTLESMPDGKGLPGRTNYVLTSNPDFKAEGCIVVHTEEELFESLKGRLQAEAEPLRSDVLRSSTEKSVSFDDVFIIGGATLYNKFYKMCDRLYITRINADLDADTFVEDMAADPAFELESESEPITENGLTYKFCIYSRVDE